MKGNISLIIFVLIFITACSSSKQTYELQSRDSNSTKEIVKRDKTNINTKDFIYELALHDAVRARDLKQVKFLLQRDSDVNIQDTFGYTPLHIAVRLKELDILKELIRNGGNVNNTDNYEDTPLLDSTRNDYTMISEILICNGAYRNVKDRHDMTPLHNSTKNKNIHISRMLLSNDLTEFCRPLGTRFVDMDITPNYYEVCGEYQNSVNAQNVLDINRLDGTPMDRLQSTGTWCNKFDNNLNNDTYELVAYSTDTYERNATDSANLDVNDDIKILYNDNLKIAIDDIDEVERNNTICGDIVHGEPTKVSLSLYNYDTNETFGLFDTNLTQNRWCAYNVKGLSYGKYLAKAKGVDKNKNRSVAIDDTLIYNAPEFLITMDKIEDQNDTNVTICGDIVTGNPTKVDLNLTNVDLNKSNLYPTTLEQNNTRWCSGQINTLEDGNYTAYARGYSEENLTSDANDSFGVVLPIPEFKIAIDDIKDHNETNITICGDIVVGNPVKVDLNLTKLGVNVSGVFSTTLDENKTRWCTPLIGNIQDGTYSAYATGYSEENLTSYANDTFNVAIPKPEFEISMHEIEDQNDSNVTICGDVLKGDAQKVTLELSSDYYLLKEFNTTIDTNKSTWCTTSIDDLVEGAYLARAKGVSDHNVSSDANGTFNVEFPVFIGLYEALMEEFQDDFEPWNAELTKKDLLFRFKDPKSLFTHGNSDLKSRFSNILDDFFPRYLKIIEGYKGEIAEVAIEGHTSSSYRLAKNDEERWDFNQILSQRRANAVWFHTVNVSGQREDLNQTWISETFMPHGRSYGNLIYNSDGTENADASRRVEFRILRKKGAKPVMKQVVEEGQ